jgi:deazaflavin-dependent oxidoreductase (nitroreductase family)
MRSFYRAPIGLYRAGLGWILGERFLMLTHTGRVTGKARNVVLEVVRYDRAKDTFFVASGWGMRSDWLQNILKQPHVQVHFKRRSFPALAEQLPVEDAELEMLDYGRRHPAALKQLARLMGYQIDSTESAYRELGRYIPVVRLQEVTTGEGT